MVTWKPPQDTGGEQPGYAVRFFDGENYDSSQSKVTFEYYDDPDRYWAKWDDCPTDRIIYAEIRARNSAGSGPYSEKVDVSDPEDCAPPTCPVCPTAITSSSCSESRRMPGNVVNVQAVNCSIIVWDAPEDVDCCKDELTYKIRIYSGSSHLIRSQRVVLSSSKTWVTFTADDIPSGRPLHAVVKARSSEGVHSAQWSEAIVVSESTTCPPPTSK